ncbi:HsdM family class I SAM-dependent methyltransferase [Flavobacterium inviolabile]|uniref:HsdM family class I SAM-dependent methyltransferase n=1 Tax=Flavobacterium inviolabile TaxID=2748320 RepID=UPI0015A804DD|nr:N-6 DNA methylase [Flavobacterium inviolabile]
MQNRLEKTLDETRKIYVSGNESFRDFCDFTLSIITWNLLSDARISPPNFKNTTSDKYNFTSVLKTLSHNAVNIHSTINEALHYWNNLLQNQQKYGLALLKWDDAITENLPGNSWKLILQLWGKFFSIFPSDNRDILCEFWEYIERYFVAAYNNENAYLTPVALISTMTQYLRGEEKNISIYDPYARTGNLLAGAQHIVPGVQEIVGMSSTRLSWKLATIRLLFTGVQSNIHLSNSSKIDVNNDTFDMILSNPPYGDSRDSISISVKDQHLATIIQKTKRLEVLFLSHMLDKLSDDGRAAILLPSVFLTGSSSVKSLMAYILYRNILDVVVELPQGLFERTAIAPVLFCLNKKRKKDKNIILINATNEMFKSGRQLYLNEKTLTAWLQQIQDGSIPNEKNIIKVAPHEVVTADYNFYKLLHLQEKEDNGERKPVAQLLVEGEQIQNNLVLVQREIAVLIQNYNN